MQIDPSQQCDKGEQLRPEHDPKAPQAPHAQAPSHVRERERVPIGHDPHELTPVSTAPGEHALLAHAPNPVQSSQVHDCEQLRVLLCVPRLQSPHI